MYFSIKKKEVDAKSSSGQRISFKHEAARKKEKENANSLLQLSAKAALKCVLLH